MFKTLFETGTELNTKNMVLIAIMSIISGFILSLTYLWTHKQKSDKQGFIVTLFMLPIVVAVIIILVASDLAKAFSLAGVFALIRFRSEQAETKDITYILISAGIGLSIGLGYIYLGLLITVICCALLFVLDITKFGANSSKLKRLKIVIPENLNYEHAFDDVMQKYCKYSHYEKVKTTDFGSLFELSYNVVLLDDKSEKEFIDELRIINGNLDIILVLA